MGKLYLIFFTYVRGSVPFWRRWIRYVIPLLWMTLYSYIRPGRGDAVVTQWGVSWIHHRDVYSNRLIRGSTGPGAESDMYDWLVSLLMTQRVV